MISGVVYFAPHTHESEMLAMIVLRGGRDLFDRRFHP